MTDLRQALIALYSAYDSKTIGQVSAYAELCKEHENDRPFLVLREQIQRQKCLLESIADLKPQEQVRFCLHALLDGGVNANSRAALYELATAQFRSHWGPEHKEFFQREAQELFSRQEKYDYFLSFTTRNPCSGAKLRVNREYLGYIKSVLTREALEDRSEGTENLLAEAIDAVLRQQRLRGFRYQEHQGDGRDVGHKLREGCRNARCLIQLVDNDMFVEPQSNSEPRSNYCQVEFQEALDGGAVLLLPAAHQDLTEIIVRSEVPEGYHSWYDAVGARDKEFLPYARSTLNEREIDQVRAKVERIAKLVHNRRRSILTSVPR